MDDRDIGAGASAEKIEAAYRVADQAVLAALLLAQEDPGEGRRALNEALLERRCLERLRLPSGKLTTAAIEASRFGADALQAARAEFAGAWGRTRFGSGQLVIAWQFYRQALRARARAAVFRVLERVLLKCVLAALRKRNRERGR